MNKHLRTAAIGVVAILAVLCHAVGAGTLKVVKFHELVFDGDDLVFRIEVDGAKRVFIAGSFNNWADNDGGRVTDEQFALSLAGDALFEKRLRLAPGTHKFKYVIDGASWVAPDGYEKDGDGNAVFHLAADRRLSVEPVVVTEPHRSFYDIPFSNGFSSAKFNVATKRIDSFKNHIYSKWDESSPSVNLIRFVDFELTDDAGARFRLSDMDVESAGYLDGSGIVSATFARGSIRVSARFYCSFLRDENNLRAVIELPDSGLAAISHIVDLNPKLGFKAADTGVFAAKAGSVSVWDMRLGSAYILNLRHDSNPARKWENAPDESVANGLSDEIKFWSRWHERTRYPDDITAHQKELYRQSLSILKMGQCREPGRPHGQILASLPPGMWNICWIRDAAYALNGLVAAGHLAESKDALAFFLNAECGKYIKFSVDGREVGVGRPYQISVCRYYGSGEEESDGGDDPNIELDGFGLFLWVLESYVNAADDTVFLSERWDTVREKIADVLVHSIDPDVKLIRRDSSIWERHIRDNQKENGAKYFTYTTITAIKGLEAAANLADRMGDRATAAGYRQARATLLDGFFARQVDPANRVIKASAEQTEIERYMDASVIEAVNFGVVDPQGAEATATLDAIEKYLRVKSRKSGYFRSQDGTHYDNQEWVVIDLRIATAMAKMGRPDQARDIAAWVTNQSRLNFNLIAELYNETTANYEGAVPMCGFGPGAYIARFWAR